MQNYAYKGGRIIKIN